MGPAGSSKSEKSVRRFVPPQGLGLGLSSGSELALPQDRDADQGVEAPPALPDSEGFKRVGPPELDREAPTKTPRVDSSPVLPVLKTEVLFTISREPSLAEFRASSHPI